MIHPQIWQKVPLQWAPVPKEWLKGKKLHEMIMAYQARTIEIQVDYDNVIHWRRYIDNPTLELGL